MGNITVTNEEQKAIDVIYNLNIDYTPDIELVKKFTSMLQVNMDILSYFSEMRAMFIDDKKKGFFQDSGNGINKTSNNFFNFETEINKIQSFMESIDNLMNDDVSKLNNISSLLGSQKNQKDSISENTNIARNIENIIIYSKSMISNNKGNIEKFQNEFISLVKYEIFITSCLEEIKNMNLNKDSREIFTSYFNDVRFDIFNELLIQYQSCLSIFNFLNEYNTLKINAEYIRNTYASFIENITLKEKGQKNDMFNKNIFFKDYKKFDISPETLIEYQDNDVLNSEIKDFFLSLVKSVGFTSEVFKEKRQEAFDLNLESGRIKTKYEPVDNFLMKFYENNNPLGINNKFKVIIKMINEILNVNNVNKNITENKLNFFGKIIKSFLNEDENKIDNSKEKTFNQTNKLKQNLMELNIELKINIDFSRRSLVNKYAHIERLNDLLGFYTSLLLYTNSDDGKLFLDEIILSKNNHFMNYDTIFFNVNTDIKSIVSLLLMEKESILNSIKMEDILLENVLSISKEVKLLIDLIFKLIEFYSNYYNEKEIINTIKSHNFYKQEKKEANKKRELELMEKFKVTEENFKKDLLTISNGIENIYKER